MNTFSPNTKIKSAEVNANFADVLSGVALFSWDSVRLSRSGNQTINTGSGALTTLLFDTETFDSNTLHSTSSNTGRITIAVAGLYRLYAFIRWIASNTTGITEVTIRVNGTTVIDFDDQPSVTSVNRTQHLYTEYRLAVGDYVEVAVYQTTGGDQAVSSTGTHFGASKGGTTT